MTKILIIDDVEGVRDSIRRTLERSGYDVVSARDGKAGLQTIEQEAPDLVITDILMPEMEGLQTIQEIAKSQPDLPVIAITGSIGTPYLQAALKFGATHGLYKPFSQEALLATVRTALDERPAHGKALTES